MNKGKLQQLFLLVPILMSLVFPVTVIAATQGTELQQDVSQPEITVNTPAGDVLELVIQFPANPLQKPVDDQSAPFNEVHYDHPSDPGVPDLPVLYKDIEVPTGQSVEFEILDSVSYTAALGEGNLPVSIPNTEQETEKCGSGELCSVNPAALFQQGSGIYPDSPAQLLDTYILRGHQVAQLAFWPVQYDPETQTVQIYQQLTVRLTIPGGVSHGTVITSLASDAFEALASESLLNYIPQVQADADRSTGGDGYLIIAPDSYTSTLAPLVDLKTSQGFSVTVAGLSTTGSTPDAIKAYIQNAYNNWPIAPTYVLLVGDLDNGTATMPAFTGESSGRVTDLYYGTVDGSDWVPDIFVGRLPARSTSQLITMINNLVTYNNFSGAESWVMKAALLASSDADYWDIAEGTQNYVIANDTLPAGYTGTFPNNPQAGGDKLYAHTYGAGNSNVINALNNGRALVAYSGHGSQVSWGGPSLSESNIRSLSNSGALSVVASFACLTGDYNVTESFGETWMLQANKGAVAFIGSSSSSYWGPDDIMERAMMDALYSGEDSANVVGSFMFAGLMAVESERYGTGTAQSRYYWESYNLLGDPSLELLIGPKVSDFTLSVEPSTVSVCQSSDANSTVAVGQTNGFSSPVSLDVTGVPSDVSATLGYNPVTPPNVSQLTISADRKADVGDYTLTVSGSSGGLYHEYSLGLSIFASAPDSVTLTNPANGATDVSIDTYLNWEEPQSSLTYEIQIALDSGFNQVIYSQSGLDQPSFDPTGSLANGTTYYWRVRAYNACGTSSYSSTYQFKTILAAGDCPEGTQPLDVYQTSFENNPAGWTHSGTNDTWALSTSRSTSPNTSYHSVDKNAISLQRLTSPTISIPETYDEPVSLKFWQWTDIEASGTTGCFDGAILEISDNGGQSWIPVPESMLLTNPYYGTISDGYGNPLGGNPGWCGLQDWTKTVVDLSDYAGQDVQFRFSQGSDASIGLEGWYIDDFSVTACEAKPDYRPYLNADVVSAGSAPGQEINIQIQLVNAGLNPDSYDIDLSNSDWVIDLKTREVIDLQPGETTTLEITVTVPADATFGQVQQVILSVTSQGDPNNPPATDQATFELSASLLSFIPFMSRP
ncbi:MAG: Ig-like domain-containing protein, partial [Anaerolineaceae bacterium]|nr:Ig-like domain-containing protein [Anaerolineaceae bacterium]